MYTPGDALDAVLEAIEIHYGFSEDWQERKVCDIDEMDTHLREMILDPLVYSESLFCAEEIPEDFGPQLNVILHEFEERREEFQNACEREDEDAQEEFWDEAREKVKSFLRELIFWARQQPFFQNSADEF